MMTVLRSRYLAIMTALFFLYLSKRGNCYAPRFVMTLKQLNLKHNGIHREILDDKYNAGGFNTLLEHKSVYSSRCRQTYLLMIFDEKHQRKNSVPDASPYASSDDMIDTQKRYHHSQQEQQVIGVDQSLGLLNPDLTIPVQGTQNKFSTTINLIKCICGAGSFALPHVFLEEGVLGGVLAITLCAVLAVYTMQSINNSRAFFDNESKYYAAISKDIIRPSSYVELTELVLGKSTSNLVLALTLAGSLGVCSTYIVFIGQILSSLSMDSESNNIVRTFLPDIDVTTWKLAVTAVVFPLSLVRNYGIFAFTSALGVTAVLGGITSTLAYGIFVEPGVGLVNTLSTLSQMKMLPDSFADAFGGSFGTIAYLFCINFLTFPIMNSMKNPKDDYNDSVLYAVASVWVVNVLFAILCLGFFCDETQDLVLQNLENGTYLSATKLLLCVDLLFTFPIVFSSGRQVLEDYVLKRTNQSSQEISNGSLRLSLQQTVITAIAVGSCFCLSQLGGFSVVANLVGGIAQGVLAFIIPPAISLELSRKDKSRDKTSEVMQYLIGGFGVVVVTLVTYYTFKESFS